MWKDKIPSGALTHVTALVKDAPVLIKISRPRKSKWGDFRSPFNGKPCIITVNADLLPHHFLIVFLHEWAHYLTWKAHKHRVLPHGIEWKNHYAELVRPVLDQGLFPEEIHEALLVSIRNPSASSCRDLGLMRALRSLDDTKQGKNLIEHLELGDRFVFKKRAFVLVKKARLRFHCREESSKRMFAFHALAEIQPL